MDTKTVCQDVHGPKRINSIDWLILQHHREVGIFGSYWNVLTTTGGISMKLGTDLHFFKPKYRKTCDNFADLWIFTLAHQQKKFCWCARKNLKFKLVQYLSLWTTPRPSAAVARSDKLYNEDSGKKRLRFSGLNENERRLYLSVPNDNSCHVEKYVSIQPNLVG